MNNLVKLPNHTGKRIQILTPTELEALYERPAFTQEERMSFFLLKPEEKILLDLPTSLETKIHVILQLGYFNCKHHFFEFTLDEVKEDTEYVLNQYFEQIAIKKTVLTREVKRQNQQRVLEITGYKIYNGAQHEAVLLNRAKELCRISMDPMFIFNEILSLLAQNKITLPGYSTLQEKIISRAIKAEQNRIGLILEANLSTKDRGQIMLLFKEDDGFYAITVLKKEPGNFKLRAIRKESAMFSLYQPLYLIAKRILPLFDISQKAIAYYASLVEHYTVRGLMRLEAIQRYLWLICFIQDRYQRMLYNLTTMFIYTFNQYQEAINKKAKERLLTHVLEPSDQDVKTAQLLRNYTSDEIDTSQPFEKIRQNAYQNILSADQINYIADTLEDKKKGEKLLIQFRWEAIALLAKSYKLPLRTLIKVLPIEGDRHKPLKEGQKFLQTTFLQSKSLNLVRFDLFPLKFIGKNDTPYIYDEELKSIDVDRYEFECYRQLVAHIQDYSLFVPDSFHYENFSSQILQNWKERKGEILAKLNRPFLNKPFSEFIAERANPLDARIRRVNEAIKNGENKAVKIKSNKDGSQRWSIPYTKNSLGVNNTIYEKLPPVNILRILQFSNKKTHFMQQLTHIKPHYAKSKQDDMMNYLNLLARATNMQKRELASLTGLSLAQLETADSNYFRLETLREANNTLNNELAKLSVFRHWYLLPDKLHASLDGIKLTTASETLLSRYSPKYFGLGKGVTGYYLIVNHAAVNTLTHGPNEHESHFVFDMAYNNHSDLQPDIFSTDTEGSNQLNFLLLHVIDRLFAPRYKSFNKKVGTIICFGDPERFKDCLIKPERSLNTELILSEEDNIKHIIASLLMGDMSQSHLIAKLSSKNFSSKTKRALWEMNGILMTEHLLNCIEYLSLRQAIQAALNRGEAYNQLRRHLERVNGRHVRGKNQTEIAINNECARLVSNCIVYYNGYLLNHLLARMEKEGNVAACEKIKHFSPVAWAHIHFHGKIDLMLFNEDMPIDIDALLASLEAIEIL